MAMLLSCSTCVSTFAIAGSSKQDAGQDKRTKGAPSSNWNVLKEWELWWNGCVQGTCTVKAAYVCGTSMCWPYFCA